MISAWILVFVCNNCAGAKIASVGEFATQQVCENARTTLASTSGAWRSYKDNLLCLHNGGNK